MGMRGTLVFAAAVLTPFVAGMFCDRLFVSEGKSPDIILASIDEVLRSLENIEATMDVAARSRFCSCCVEAPEDPVRAVIGIVDGPAESREEVGSTTVRGDPHDSCWAAALDPVMARTLLEIGLTPFDAGVAKILSESRLALDSSEERCNLVCDDLRAQRDMNVIGRRAYNEQHEHVVAQMVAERKEIVSVMRAKLLLLSRQ